MTSQFQQKLIKAQESILASALRLTHNLEDAKDLAQDTFLRALEHEDKYEEQNQQGWMYSIEHSIFINDYNKKKRMNTLIDPDADLYNLDDTYSTDSPEIDRYVEHIRSAIDKLPNDLKTPFSMITDGYKYTEIAKKTKRPMGTIKNQIFKARQLLQDTLKEYRDK